MFKNVWGVLVGLFLCYSVYQTLGVFFYTVESVKFYEIDYSFSEHGVALNGRTSIGNTINVLDLKAVAPTEGGGAIKEWCPEVVSQRGHVTMGFTGGGEPVCCHVADGQWLVPFKDEGGVRHYLCGAWPHLDWVSQPVKNSKLGLYDL